jgi:5-methylcytosine-specific restriction endonuclease McrA
LGILRTCFQAPPIEAFEAALLLSEAQTAHLAGDRSRAASLIESADMPVIRAWTESLWGKASPHVTPVKIANPLPVIIKIPVRMPNGDERALLHKRDGHHCRFCGLPLIRAEVRKRIAKLYPASLKWGRTNLSQHAAFQAMWAQYDHILPHARGGDNSLENLVITCAPCNFARMDFTLEEVGLMHPLLREPASSSWCGLEAFK